MVKSGQAVTVMFTTSHPTTGAATDADATPVATLYVNGTADAATVTETKVATGTYSLAVTLPALSAGDIVSLGVAATVATVAGAGIVWQDTADTKLVSDLQDLAAGAAMTLTAAYDAAKTAASQASVSAIPTTPLLAGNYVAPDNAGIAAVLEDTATTLPATLTAIAGYIDTEVAATLAAVDTEVAAIKAKTDNLPASPAVAGEAASAVATLHDFDPASDVVAHVTLVDTVTSLTEELTASIDPADVQSAMTSQGYTAARAVKLDNLDTPVSSVGGAVIDDGVTITQATLGTDNIALGRVMPYGEIIVYRNDVAEWGPFQADADGDYSFELPSGSVWDLKARANGYATTVTEVSTIGEVS